MRYLSLAVAATVCVCVTGCNWSSTDDANSWNDSYSWIDFSGTYRSPDGSPVVSGFVNDPGSSPGEARVTDEVIGVTAQNDQAYSGLVANSPIVPSSLTITIGSVRFTDNGQGLLVGSEPGTTGFVTYSTGAWSVDLGGIAQAGGISILATYRYNFGGTAGGNVPGNTGDLVYTLTVIQTGNKLTISDNRGWAYGGQITGVSLPGGDASGGSSGDVVMNYEVSGNGVRIVGTFSALYAAPSGSTTGGTTGSALLSNRTIQGTWIEPSVTGDVYGVGGSQNVTVTLPVTTTPTTTQQTQTN